MCIKPNTIFLPRGNGYEKTLVPCRHCWACRKNKVDDLIGRMLCESSTASWSNFYTLTYDDRKIVSPKQIQTIVKRDFQNFIKSVRFAGHDVRYMAAGEFGTRKGRSHFHVILCGKGNTLPVSKYWNGKNALEHWPWGHVDIEECNENTIRYVAKYLTKGKAHYVEQSAAPHDEWVTYSKKPLLGADFIFLKAERQAEMKVFPQTMNYSPPGARNNARYTFYGKAQFLYYDFLHAMWPEMHKAPKSEWAENAYLRWVKWRQKKAWDELALAEKEAILMDSFQTKSMAEPEESVASKMKREYDRIDEKFRQRRSDKKWQGVAKQKINREISELFIRHRKRLPEKPQKALRNEPETDCR